MLLGSNQATTEASKPTKSNYASKLESAFVAAGDECTLHKQMRSDLTGMHASKQASKQANKHGSKQTNKKQLRSKQIRSDLTSKQQRHQQQQTSNQTESWIALVVSVSLPRPFASSITSEPPSFFFFGGGSGLKKGPVLIKLSQDGRNRAKRSRRYYKDIRTFTLVWKISKF